ncbi:MAG: FAD:protein FMN transferase [Bacillota bacterium]
MIRKTTIVLLTILLIFNLAACGNTEKKRYEAEFLTLFDTVTRIVGYSDNKEEFTKKVQMIHDSMEEYHQLYDIYNDYPGINNIKTINDQAGIAPVKVDRRIIDLLLFSKKAYEMSDGKVNVAFGAVLKIWHDHRTMGIEDPEKATLPSMDQLAEASKHTNIDQVIIDEENSTVYLEDPEMRLDVGAVAKGYATEEVTNIALKNEFTSVLISVGGNVRGIGEKEDSHTPWKVGVQNPYDQNGENISQVTLKDESLVTSGIYERYFTVNGKNYHHIIDPVTLFPAEYFVSVTILCPDSGMADALSTSVFNMSFDQGKALIESLPETEAMWAFQDGTIKYSSNFQESISR